MVRTLMKAKIREKNKWRLQNTNTLELLIFTRVYIETKSKVEALKVIVLKTSLLRCKKLILPWKR